MPFAATNSCTRTEWRREDDPSARISRCSTRSCEPHRRHLRRPLGREQEAQRDCGGRQQEGPGEGQQGRELVDKGEGNQLARGQGLQARERVAEEVVLAQTARSERETGACA